MVMLQEVQRLAGTRDLSEKLGRSWHSPTIPARATDFLRKHCLIYLSCLYAYSHSRSAALLALQLCMSLCMLLCKCSVLSYVCALTKTITCCS